MQTEFKGKVAVLFGGSSAEREVSLRSGAAVLKGLVESGVDAHPFDPSERPLQALKEDGFDVAFIVLHGRGGEDGTVQGALELMGIPYTGSGVLGSALAMDKVRTKQVWQSLGLPTAAYRVVFRGEYQPSDASALLDALNGAVMVKPANEGSSIGMAKATTALELDKAIQAAFEYDQSVLLEQYITGQEYTVAILGEQVLPAIRMETPREFYDYEAKYSSDTTRYYCPCGLDEHTETQLKKDALAAFKAVAATGWGRVDAMRDQQGKFYLLEANTVPGMTAKSLVPMAAKTAGMSFNELLLAILGTVSR